MSDGELEFSGLGSVSVRTEGMVLATDAWCTAAEAVGGAYDALLEAWSLTDGAHSESHIADRLDELLHIAGELSQLRELMEDSAQSLDQAAGNYGRAESTGAALMQGFWGFLGASAGFVFAPLGMALALIRLGEQPDEAKKPEGLSGPTDLGPVGQGVMDFLSDRTTVDHLGYAVSAGDDFLLGPLGPGVPLLLGQQGAGLTGTALSAGALLAVGNALGYLQEGPVAAKPRELSTATAPQGVVERLDRIPGAASPSDVQVRIDRYEVPGEPDRFEVYIAGTESFDPVSRQTASDMTSNVAAVAGLPSGMERVVVEAMMRAGIGPDNPVGFIGYSQGGAIATDIASRNYFNTQTLLTIGAPAGEVQIPETVDAIVIRHSEDLVTVLGGAPQQTSALVVERELFGEDEPPEGLVVPAHHYEYYQETGRMLDESDASVARSAIARLDALSEGATRVTSTTYEAVRTDVGAPPPEPVLTPNPRPQAAPVPPVDMSGSGPGLRGR